MADYFETGWDALEAQLRTTWSDVNTFYRATQAQRFNWRDDILAGKLVPPFGVVTFSPFRETDLGATNWAKTARVCCYYVRLREMTTGEAATNRTVDQIVQAKGAALKDALRSKTSSAYHLYPGTEPDVDYSHSQEANKTFNEVGAPLWSVSVEFDFLVGETS